MTQGLRERKKQLTRDALVDAAYGLIAAEGITAATADAIAERAGVSRRTFFNYFPTVDAVFDEQVRDFFAEVGDELTACPGDLAVMDCLEAILAAEATSTKVERIGVLAVAALTSPEAKAVMHRAVDEWLPQFAELLRSRLPADSDDLYVMHLATAVLSSAQAAIFVWAARTGGALTPSSVDELRSLFIRSMRQLRTGFDPKA